MPKRTAIVIQARLGSTRLPAKVLLPLPTGRSVIQEIVHRMNHLVHSSPYLIGGVYLAVPDGPDCSIFISHFKASNVGVAIFPGNEHSVLKRFAELESYLPDDVDSIMRITGDCPLINPKICLSVAQAFRRDDELDYCSNVGEPRTYTRGLDCEVFRRSALTRIAPSFASDSDHEHVTTSMRTCKNLFMVGEVQSERPCRPENYSLDTLADYRRIWKHFIDFGGVLDV